MEVWKVGGAQLAIAVTVAWVAAAQGQTITPPDAGQTLQQLRAQPLAPNDKKDAAGLLKDSGTQAAPEESQDSGPRAPIKKVVITGNTVIATNQLESLVADLAGKDWTLSQLRSAASRITDLYHARGYLLVQAYLPAQELDQGELIIAVLEGRLGTVKIDNQTRMNAARLDELSQARFPPGSVVQTDSTNRGLLILQSVPGVNNVDAGLRPGSEVGTTDLDITLGREPLLTGYVAADNSGNVYTGKNRVLGAFNLNNVTGYGDRLSVQTVLSTDNLMQYGRAAWDLPLGNDGARWGGAYNNIHYKLGGRFAKLEDSGFARAASLYGSYPILISQRSHLNAGLSLEHRSQTDRQDAVGYRSDRDINAAVISIDGDLTDIWLQQPAVNTAHLTLTSGNLSLLTDSVAALDATTAHTAGHYNKLTLDLSREQQVAENFSLLVAGTAQLSDKNIDSSEQMFLGGPNRLRAYPTGDTSGDEGWFASAELRRPLTPWLKGGVFFEGGAIRINHNPYIDQPNVLNRAGAGIGFNASWRQFSLKTSIAWRVGSKTAVSSDDKQPQLWLSGTGTF